MGDFGLGGFCPDNNFTFFPCGLIQLTLNTKQIMFWEDFVPGKISSRVGFSPLFYHSITINIHQDQVLDFSGFFVVGGFCPNKNSTLSYVYHHSKYSYRSSYILWGILSWGDFVPTTTLPYSIYSITANIHIEQHMFWEDFIPGGILSREGLSSLL